MGRIKGQTNEKMIGSYPWLETVIEPCRVCGRGVPVSVEIGCKPPIKYYGLCIKGE